MALNLDHLTVNGSEYEIVDAAARASLSAHQTKHVVDVLPTASADTTTGIYLLPEASGGEDNYAEYITVTVKASDGTESYKWEKIGSTKTELAGYSQKGHTHTYTKMTGVPSHTYTPEGENTAPVFTGTSMNLSVSGTPTGTVSQPTFTGTQKSVSVKGKPTGGVTISEGAGVANYTPKGTVAVTPSVTLNTANVGSMTGVGSLPALKTSYADGKLTITFSAGTLPTMESKAVATGVKSATATGTFTGTGADLEAVFTGNDMTSSGNFIPEGTVSQPTFTGKALTSSGSATPAGTVSAPKFTGKQATLAHTVNTETANTGTNSK